MQPTETADFIGLSEDTCTAMTRLIKLRPIEACIERVMSALPDIPIIKYAQKLPYIKEISI